MSRLGFGFNHHLSGVTSASKPHEHGSRVAISGGSFMGQERSPRQDTSED
jgi:hypothetical protein